MGVRDMPYVAPLALERNPATRGLDFDGDVELPANSAGRAAAALVADLRFRNKMTILLAMGDRPATEMVAELAVVHGLEAAVDELLDRYVAIPDEALDIANGRDLSPLPIHEVWR